MRYLLLAVFALVSACGSPVEPTRRDVPDAPAPTGTATLSVTVTGHISGRPLAGIPVELDPKPKPFRTAPTRDRLAAPVTGTIAGSTLRLTDAKGQARWLVTVGEVHTIRVRGRNISDLVLSDAGWLVSLPE